MEPDWVEHAIWWQVHPLSFVGAESDSAGVALTHRLGRIVDWFDYAVELGASGVALGPVFASGTHGYDITDHFRIDPRLGDDADFRALVAAAHDRGLRVLLDGVFNHVGREFPAFVAVRAARRPRGSGVPTTVGGRRSRATTCWWRSTTTSPPSPSTSSP